MFGRLKLALVALVMMPAAAFAADRAPQHAPGASADAVVVIAKVAAGGADSGEAARKHHSSAKPEEAIASTIAAFLDHLRSEPAPAAAATGTKQAAASVTAGEPPARMRRHQPG